MEIVNPVIEQYAEEHTSPESPLLSKINRETHLEVLQPIMLSGHLQGRVLSLLSKLIRPKHILEVGTYTGYSALCLAEGLRKEGELHTIDLNDMLDDRIKSYFSESEFASNIHFHLGDATQIIPGLKNEWDLVFIDADKENYITYYNQLIDQMSSGGIILADNVLWKGKVTESNISDQRTKTLDEYNKMVHNDSRVENVLLPIRDGIMVTRKK